MKRKQRAESGADRLETELNSTRATLENTTRNTGAALTILAVLKEASEAEVARLRLQVGALTSELGNVSAALAVSESRTKDPGNSLIEENKQLRVQAEAINSELGNVRAALAVLESRISATSAADSSMEGENQRLCLQVGALNSELGHVRAALADLKSRTSAERKSMVEENKRLKEAEEDFGFERSRLELDNEQAKVQILRYKAKLMALQGSSEG